MSDEQTIKMLYETNYRFVTELPMRNFTESSFAGIVGDLDQRCIHVINGASTVFIFDVRWKFVSDENWFDAHNFMIHKDRPLQMILVVATYICVSSATATRVKAATVAGCDRYCSRQSRG